MTTKASILRDLQDYYQVDIDDAKLMVGKGWHEILDVLYAYKPENTLVTDVKEKYGGLRFYITGAPYKYHELIDLAEKASYLTCELCGKTGRLYTDGWWKTRCDECK